MHVLTSRTTQRRRAMRSAAAVMPAGLVALWLSGCDDADDSAGAASGPGSAPSTNRDTVDDPADQSDAQAGDESGTQAVEACLSGDWEMDRPSDFWDIPAGDADDVTGTVFVAFSADGQFRMDFERWYMYYDHGAEAGNYVEATWDGTLSGEYAVDHEGFAVVDVTGSSATIESVIAFSGDLEEETLRVEDQPVPMVFACEGDRLLGFALADQNRSEPFAAYDRTQRS